MSSESSSTVRRVRLILPTPHAARLDEETLWGEPVDEPADCYRLLHAPFLSNDYAAGDIVRTRKEATDRPPVVEDVAFPCGGRTLQVLFAQALEPEQLDAELAKLDDFRATIEHANNRWFSISVGVDGNAQAAIAQARFWKNRGLAQVAIETEEIEKLSFALLDEPLHHWIHDDPKDAIAIAVDEVLDGAAPILHVVRADADGAPWQFIGSSPPTEERARACYLAEIFTVDPTLHDLHDLPVGWHAVRGPANEPWQYFDPASET